MMILYDIDIDSQFRQRILKHLVCAQIDHVIAKGTSHQKFHRQIIHHFGVFEQICGSQNGKFVL